MADIIIFGATGYTGRLITAYLQEHPERSSFTLAIAGRSKAKLGDLKRTLRLDDSVNVFQVDVTKPDQVEEVVKQAKVVINTVGPFWLWGEHVVASCARHGKLYVDTSGEVPWLQEMICKYDYLASKTHAVIIPFCGFDSVPSDLVVYLANRTLKSFAGPDTGLAHSTSAMKMEGGGMSGGSISTVFTTFEKIPAWKRNASRQDFAVSTVRGVPSPSLRLVYKLPFSDPPIYGGISAVAESNRQLVQRTWGLHELQKYRAAPQSNEDKLRSYGSQFKYEEFAVMPGVFSSVLLSVTLGVFVLAASFLSPFRWVLKKLAPSPGEGPSLEARTQGMLELTNVTASVPTPTKPEVHVRTTLRFQGEPGYFLTSVTASEAALALLFQRSELPSFAQEGGILTPMSALGDVFVKRLEASGRFTFNSEVLLEESTKTR